MAKLTEKQQKLLDRVLEHGGWVSRKFVSTYHSVSVADALVKKGMLELTDTKNYKLTTLGRGYAFADAVIPAAIAQPAAAPTVNAEAWTPRVGDRVYYTIDPQRIYIVTATDVDGGVDVLPEGMTFQEAVENNETAWLNNNYIKPVLSTEEYNAIVGKWIARRDAFFAHIDNPEDPPPTTAITQPAAAPTVGTADADDLTIDRDQLTRDTADVLPMAAEWPRFAATAHPVNADAAGDADFEPDGAGVDFGLQNKIDTLKYDLCIADDHIREQDAQIAALTRDLADAVAEAAALERELEAVKQAFDGYQAAALETRSERDVLQAFAENVGKTIDEMWGSLRPGSDATTRKNAFYNALEIIVAHLEAINLSPATVPPASDAALVTVAAERAAADTGMVAALKARDNGNRTPADNVLAMFADDEDAVLTADEPLPFAIGDRVRIVGDHASNDYAREELLDVLNQTGTITAYSPDRARLHNGHVWEVELSGGRKLHFQAGELCDWPDMLS